jgi:CBS domain containing-hemolysin-like protein
MEGQTWLWIIFVALNLKAAGISLLHGMVTGFTAEELDRIRPDHPSAAAALERCRDDKANVLAAFDLLHSAFVGMSALLGGILLGAEILTRSGSGWPAALLVALALVALSFVLAWATGMLPRKVGAHLRLRLTPILVPSLILVRGVGGLLRRLGRLHDGLAPPVDPATDQADAEIGSVARAAARAGKITHAESNLVANAVRLDDIPVSQVLTPRPVVTALDASLTIADVQRLYPSLPHGRLPVWDGNPDRVVGLVRRRDLLKAAGEDRHAVTVRELMGKPHILPENASLADALHGLVRNHQQLAVVVDEFGAFSGVITLEDIFESLLGMEIYEKDDPHPDMRELARQRGLRAPRKPADDPRPGA